MSGVCLVGRAAAPRTLPPTRVGIWHFALLHGIRDVWSASQAFVDCLLATTRNALCKCPNVQLYTLGVNAFGVGVFVPPVADEASQSRNSV
eukprot:3103883-Lingulodinium_polyedra.AAC.1